MATHGDTLWTIGHSTRPWELFVSMLAEAGIEVLVDVRRFAGSRRNPQFSGETMARTLPVAGVDYVPMPDLGGRRKARPDTTNTAWRNASFRAYADYMQTADFALGLDELHVIALNGPVALMCAEAVPWRCHRSLIADALTIRGVDVREIQSVTRTEVHKLTPFAHVEGLDLTYPASDEESSANSAAG